MRELVASDDLVFLHFLASLFQDAGIEHCLLGTDFTAIGGVLALHHQRLLVSDADFARAQALMQDVRAEYGS